MDLDRYLRALSHYWYVVASLVIVGLVGVWIYERTTRAQVAEATVAVLEPVTSQSASGDQALVSFGSVVESRTLSERVVNNLGLSMTAEQLQGSISAKLSRTLVSSGSSPLYIVQVKNADEKQAVLLATAVVDEARQLFAELNTINRADLDQALQPETDRLTAERDSARQELQKFEDENRAWSLPDQITAQIALVNGIHQSEGLSQVSAAKVETLDAKYKEAQGKLDELIALLPAYLRLQLEVSLAAASAGQFNDLQTRIDYLRSPSTLSDQIDSALSKYQDLQQAGGQSGDRAEPMAAGAPAEAAASPATSDSTDIALLDLPDKLAVQRDLLLAIQGEMLANLVPQEGYDAILNTQEEKLRQMLLLLPEYQRLSTRVALAENALAGIESRKVALVIDGSLAPYAEVKLLDPAHIEPNLLAILIPYFLTVVFSISAGLAAVYLLAYFSNTPFTSEEVREMMQVPVLASVPPAFKGGRRKLR